MAGNNDNLIPLTERDPEEALRIRRMGAAAVNAKRLQRKTFAEDFKDALCIPGVQAGVIKGMLERAKKDPRALALILETIGENGSTKMEVSTVESARRDAWDALAAGKSIDEALGPEEE